MPASLRRRVQQFQKELPYREAPFEGRTWGHPLHSLCSYQGKLKPSLAHWLIRIFAPSDGTVLDPLGGVGTVAFEAAQHGLNSVSNDKSPLAAIVAAAKLNPPSLTEGERALGRLLKEMGRVRLRTRDMQAAGFGLNASVADYYHPDTLDEILRARRVFLDRRRKGRGETFVWASLLHVLHGNRPYALSRTSHPVTPFHPSGPAEYRSLEQKVRARMERALRQPLPTAFRRGKSIEGDFRVLPRRVRPASIDLIVTSPPFIGMRFDRPNWLRLWFTGWTAADFHETSLGFLEREQVSSLDCYAEFFSVCARLLSDEGVLVLHVGSGGRGNLADSLEAISREEFHVAGDVVESVESVPHHGLRDRGLTTRHHLLFLTKRVRRITPESRQLRAAFQRVAS